MYRMDQREVDRIARIVKSGKLFRYVEGSECERFEKRYAERLGVKYCTLTASGTNALTAALVALGIGPGDEVLVPACTYMATAMAVLAVGAIPVVVDIDDSLTMDPEAADRTVGPRTRAMIPVHMWGVVCDMKRIMRVARKHDLYVVEDACQCVGGAYQGRMLGSIGHIGAFSFNYYKNMSCGEGGAVVTSKKAWADRVNCAVDPCNFYWKGRSGSSAGFAFNGARASEFEGAILNVQLDRLDGMIRSMRRQKKRILGATASTGLRPARANSLDDECGSHVMYTFDKEAAAKEFAELTGGIVTIETGRHVYTEWDQVIAQNGAPHPALNPYTMKENAACRKSFDMKMKTLDILRRTVLVATNPDFKAADVKALIDRIKSAAARVLGERTAVPAGRVGA